MPRPGTLPRWSETAGGAAGPNVTVPSGAEQDAGWTNGQNPVSSGKMNWLQQLAYDWFKWISAKVTAWDEANTWTAKQSFNGAGGPTDAGWDFTAGTLFNFYQLVETVVTATFTMRRYMGLTGTVTTINAHWDEAASKWKYDNATNYAVRFGSAWGPDQYIYDFTGAAAAGWNDANWVLRADSGVDLASLDFAEAVDGAAPALALGADTKFNSFAHAQTLGAITNDGTGKITINKAGTYRIFASGTIHFAVTAAAENIAFKLFKNGALLKWVGEVGQAEQNTFAAAAGEFIVVLAVNDYIELYYNANNAGGAGNQFMREAQMTVQRVK